METDCTFIGGAGKFNLGKKNVMRSFKFIFWEYPYGGASIHEDFRA
jgi:hypothetical protein